MIRTTGRVIKAKSVVHDPDSPKQMKTTKVLPKKKAKVQVQDGDEEEVKFISSEKKKFQVLTPETIAKMKTNFELAFHRNYDREDSAENRLEINELTHSFSTL